MRIPWYTHGNWKLDPTQLQTLEKDILRVGVTEEKEQVITTYHAKDKDLECLDFLHNFYKERVDEISKDQFSSLLHNLYPQDLCLNNQFSHLHILKKIRLYSNL